MAVVVGLFFFELSILALQTQHQAGINGSAAHGQAGHWQRLHLQLLLPQPVFGVI